MKWMKKNIGLGASISHFIVREENGVYITTCSLANARKEEWIDLTMDEIKTVALDRRARCGKCEYSPRTIPPEKFWVEPS
jgi:hypothetical protein